MEKQFDFRTMVGKYSVLPLDRLQVTTDFSQFDLSGIRRGIVFVFAAWSGSAVANWGRLTRLLSTIDLSSLTFIVLDHDCMTDKDMIQVFGHVFHGYGETLWIRDGRVIAESSARQPESLILKHTTKLLDDSCAHDSTLFPAFLSSTKKTRWQRSLIPVPEESMLYGHEDPPGWVADQNYRLIALDRRLFSIAYSDGKYNFVDTGETLSDQELRELMRANMRGLKQSPDPILRQAERLQGEQLFRFFYERVVDLPDMSNALKVAGCALIVALCLAAFSIPVVLVWWFFLK